jgi:hypothetical protein
LTVSDTRQTVKMTNNNGTGLVSPIPGYPETVSVVGGSKILKKIHICGTGTRDIRISVET